METNIRLPHISEVFHHSHPFATVPRVGQELKRDAHERFGWFSVAEEGLFGDGVEDYKLRKRLVVLSKGVETLEHHLLWIWEGIFCRRCP